jgi:hypothetical protein
MPDVSSLYPQPPAPPQPQQNALTGDPLRMIGALGQLQYYQIRRQQAPALEQQPAAALANTQLANTTARMAQQADAQRRVAGGLGAMIPDNATKDDVLSATAYFARSNPDIATQYPDMIPAASDVVLHHPKGITFGKNILLNSALSPGEASTLVQAHPGPGGVERKMTVPASNLVGTRDVGQPVGEPIGQEGSATRGEKLAGSATTSNQYHADLENLKQESKVLGNIQGPTTPFEKKANETLARFGLSGLGTMTPDQLRAAESFDKISNQISLVQGQGFGGTDAARHMTVGANPSTSMSTYGREGVIDMLQGNQDTQDKARDLYLDAKAHGMPASGHDTFLHELTKPLEKLDANGNSVDLKAKGTWNGGLDPRIFQFNRLSRDNQGKFLEQLDPEDRSDFSSKYQAAIDRKWVKPLKKATTNAAQ